MLEFQRQAVFGRDDDNVLARLGFRQLCREVAQAAQRAALGFPYLVKILEDESRAALVIADHAQDGVGRGFALVVKRLARFPETNELVANIPGVQPLALWPARAARQLHDFPQRPPFFGGDNIDHRDARVEMQFQFILKEHARLLVIGSYRF